MSLKDQLQNLANQTGNQGLQQAGKMANGVGGMIKAALIISLIIPLIAGGVIFYAFQSGGGMGGFSDLANIGDDFAQTTEFSGDPEFFDPINALAEVTAFAGEGAQLYEIDTRYIRSDGTLDLKNDYSPPPNAEFKFFRSVERPDNAPAIGDGSWYETITVEAYEVGQHRNVTSRGGSMNVSYNYNNKGLDRDTNTPSHAKPGEEVSPPACSFKEIWDKAITEGAPADSVANITYNEDGYRFMIQGTKILLRFDQNCELR